MPSPCPSSPSSAASAAVPSADSLLPDSVASVFRHTPASLLGNLLGLLQVLALFAGTASTPALATWAGLFAAVWTYRALLARRFARAQPQHLAEFRAWDRAWCAGTLASGAMWGLAAVLFWGSGERLHQVALLLILYSFCVGSIPLLASRYRLLLAFCAAAFVPAIARIVADGTADSLALAAVLTMIFSVTALMGRNFRAAFDRLMELKVRTESLAEQLGVEKQAAEAARREAEAANRSKSSFFAAASHELRTPLTGVVGVVDLLRRQGGHSARTRQLLDVAAASSDSLLTLVNDLLDLAKIEAGRFEITPTDCDLRQVLMRSLEPLRLRASDKGIALHADWQAGLPAAWHVDGTRLRQVLLNLVSNAVKFTEAGSVAVAVGGRALDDGDYELTLAVSDTGIGIPPEVQARLFEDFVQADAGIAGRFGGTGLGLSISRQIVALMGGRIELSSEPGQGSSFSVSLRARPAAEAPAADDHEAPLPPHAHPLRVLLADDNPTNRLILTEYLQEWGHDVVAVEDGAQALVACSLQRFELVLLDGRMPGLSGVETLQRLREPSARDASATDSEVFVAAVSANTGADDREAFERHGAQAFLTKPVRAAQLHAAVQRAAAHELGRGRTLRHHRPEPVPTPRLDRSALEQVLALPPAEPQAPPRSARALRLHASFVRELPDHGQRLQQALNDGQLEALAEVAHALKGASVYVELPALTELADQAERHARAGRAEAALASARDLQRWMLETNELRECTT